MHLVLAFTSMHDRLLQPTLKSYPTATEMFHYQYGTAVFSQKLSNREIISAERDALWIASTLVAIQYIALVDVTSPEGAWPLKSLEPGEPDWVELVLGKKRMLDLCDPKRKESCFQEILVQSDAAPHYPGPLPLGLNDGGLHNLPEEMLDFLKLSDPSTWANSPYFRAARVISQLLPLECSQANIMTFMNFIHGLEPGFRGLWRNKDPGALLVIMYWYSKVAVPFQHWWIWYVIISIDSTLFICLTFRFVVLSTLESNIAVLHFATS